MAKEKFILLSLQGNRAKKLAQVISNESCRKILDVLADKDMTATQLSKKLGVPLSTVHYNMKNLVKGGLVVCEEFHFSAKGKEVNHYKLANKFIIIAPNAEDGFMDKLKGLLPVVGVVGAGALALQLSKRYFGGALFPQDSLKAVAMESAAPEMARMVAEDSMVDVAMEELVHATQASPFQDIVLWFVLGAIVAIGAHLLVQHLRKK